MKEKEVSGNRIVTQKKAKKSDQASDRRDQSADNPSICDVLQENVILNEVGHNDRHGNQIKHATEFKKAFLRIDRECR